MTRTIEQLECQLAQAQIGRYVAGDRLDPVSQQQLEDHILRCEACQQEVRLRRQALRAARDGSAAPTKAVVRRRRILGPTEPAVKTPLSEVLRRSGKPLILSLALAGVLIAMSFIVRNPTTVFGDRMLAQGQTSKPDKPAKSAPTPAPTPVPSATAAATSPEAPGALPTRPTFVGPLPAAIVGESPPPVAPIRQPATVVSSESRTVRPNARPSVRRTERRVAAVRRPRLAPRSERRPAPPRRAGSSIRVYDAQGNPVSPR